MIRNYLQIAVRHLLKHRNSTFLNIAGLALGMGCLVIVLIMVRYELGFDRFHTDADRIYRVVRVSQIDGQAEYRGGVSFPVYKAFKDELSQVELVGAVYYESGIQVTVNEEKVTNVRKFQEESGFTFADENFFRIFDFASTGFHWLQGDPLTSLSEPFSVVIDHSLSEKYFPGENPVGKTVNLGNRYDFTIKGVISDLTEQSDFPFRIIASYRTIEETYKDAFDNWFGVNDINQCFLRLEEGVSPDIVEKEIDDLHANRAGEELASYRKYKLQPLDEMHEDARFGNFRGRVASSQTIIALLLIGFFIIILAVINFVNLSVARSVLRSMEVGVRKVMGSNRRQLMAQFFSETFLICLGAGFLAIILAEFFLMTAGTLIYIPNASLFTNQASILWIIAVMVLAVTILAGFYPAVVLSRFRPVQTLKSNFISGKQKGLHFRWVMVTLQFVIAQIFIISTIVVIRQMNYFRNAELGFNQEAVINVSLPENPTKTLQTLRNQWAAEPQVKAVSFSSSQPSGIRRNRNFSDIRRPDWPVEQENVIFEYQAIDEEYLNLYEMHLLAGRDFISTDSSDHMIINQSLCNRLGFSTPEVAIGQRLKVFESAYDVIGVCENFHNGSLKEEINYLAMVRAEASFHTSSIKLNLGKEKKSATALSEVIKKIENSWEQAYPEYVFSYQFLDENIARFYEEERRLSRLFKILALVAIFIACLGLYGLVSFMVLRRMKEIGVRKILGATPMQIVSLYSKEFIKLVLIAFVLAGPVAYYGMQQWLQNFAYPVQLSWWIFVVGVSSGLLIALITISFQSVRAATMNPVDSLRDE